MTRNRFCRPEWRCLRYGCQRCDADRARQDMWRALTDATYRAKRDAERSAREFKDAMRRAEAAERERRECDERTN